MDYPFRYKPLVKKSFSERKNKILSEFLFSLYRNRWYQKLGLDSDFMVKNYCNYLETKPDQINDTKYPGLEIDNIVFYDLIRIEEIRKFKRQIINVTSKIKPNFLQQNNKKSFNNSFDGIDDHYGIISYGTAFNGVIEGKPETDLIKYISVGYIKGSESSIIIKYKVYPSEKFSSLLTQSLEADTTSRYEVIDVKLKHFFSRSKKYNLGYRITTLNAKYWTDKLLDEVCYQLKHEILRGLKAGVFMENSKRLFPSINTFEYTKSEFSTYERRLNRIISHGFRGMYSSDETKFSISEFDFSEKTNYGVSFFLAKRSREELDNGLNSIDYVSGEYGDEILPKLALLNFAHLQKDKIVYFRKKIFKYLQKNKASLFLKRLIKLKNKLTLSVIDFERISKDLIGENGLSERRFSNESNLPEALRKCRNENCTKKHDFKAELSSDCESSEKDIKKSFKELSSLFQTISEDNHSRANMRLQRLLFWLAILGALLTLYGTNSAWCNSWIEHFLNKIGWSIPRTNG